MFGGYYCATEILDAASGDKSFPEWTQFRAALINEEEFRNWAVTARGKASFRCTVELPQDGHFTLNIAWHEWWQTNRKANGELERPILFNAYE
jgi:hypothetical protein